MAENITAGYNGSTDRHRALADWPNWSRQNGPIDRRH